MKPSPLIQLLIVSSVISLASCSDSRQNETPAQQTKRFVIFRIDSMMMAIDSLEGAVSANDSLQSRKWFLEARLDYKQIESVIEFYFLGAAKAINGPAIDKADEHDDKVNYATGFQKVEEYLYPAFDDSAQKEAVDQIKILRSCGIRVKSLMEGTDLSDANIFQGARLEILRILTLGISGFDSPVAFLSLAESEEALKGVDQILSFYSQADGWSELHQALGNAQQYLREHNGSFDDFDRAEFIIRDLNPLSKMIFAYQRETNVPDNPWVDAIDLSTDQVIDANNYNVAHFSKLTKASDQDALIKLGQVLFFDPVLSGNNKRACASCHQPQKGFADGKAKSVAFDFKGSIARNAPTLINAVYQKSQFWDQRVQFIEDQVLDVVANPTEMHHMLDHSADAINSSDEYRGLFTTAFGPQTSITPNNIRTALTAYIVSLRSFDSPFDQYMRGKKDAMTEEQVRGFNLFMGKAKCGTCHFAPLFNGSTPPMYMETESEVLGVPSKPDTSNAVVDADLGKYHTYPRDLFKHAFKTPTVRNATLTAPYMHNGVYQSLEQVLDFYNRGGGKGIGIELPNQTLPPDKLNLTKTEQQEIITFIHALTDTVNLTSAPKLLPRLEDPALNRRAVGGEY